MGMDVSSPSSPPYTHYEEGGEDGDEYDDDLDGGWSSGEFSNSEEEDVTQQYIPNIEVSLAKLLKFSKWNIENV